jgi:hypothetical protein
MGEQEKHFLHNEINKLFIMNSFKLDFFENKNSFQFCETCFFMKNPFLQSTVGI